MLAVKQENEQKRMKKSFTPRADKALKDCTDWQPLSDGSPPVKLYKSKRRDTM